MKTRKRVASGRLWGEQAAYSSPCAAEFFCLKILLCGATFKLRHVQVRAEGNTMKCAISKTAGVCKGENENPIKKDHTHRHTTIKEENGLCCEKAILSNDPWEARTHTEGWGNWVKWTLRENECKLKKPQPQTPLDCSFQHEMKMRERERVAEKERERALDEEAVVKEV